MNFVWSYEGIQEEDDDESLCAESLKHSSRFMALPRSNLSTGVNRLVKGFKSLSQLFSKYIYAYFHVNKPLLVAYCKDKVVYIFYEPRLGRILNNVGSLVSIYQLRLVLVNDLKVFTLKLIAFPLCSI